MNNESYPGDADVQVSQNLELNHQLQCIFVIHPILFPCSMSCTVQNGERRCFPPMKNMYIVLSPTTERELARAKERETEREEF